MTTTYAPQAPTHPRYLETEMFSTRQKPRHTGHGRDAPTFNGVDDPLEGSRSRPERVTTRAAYQEGHSSSLAADVLLRLGIHRCTDIIVGFAAWRSAGLPCR